MPRMTLEPLIAKSIEAFIRPSKIDGKTAKMAMKFYKPRDIATSFSKLINECPALVAFEIVLLEEELSSSHTSP